MSLDLFAPPRRAEFSSCRRYRYSLEIPLAPGGRRVAFLMLNPSTADETQDDPTVRRCRAFARSWDFSKLLVVNIFAWRSTDPSVLADVADPIGADNDRWIRAAADQAELVICAWGKHGALHGRGDAVRRMLVPTGKLHFLRITDKEPWHPLYLPGCLTPQRWEAA